MLFRMTRAPVAVTIFTCEDVKKKQLDGENISNVHTAWKNTDLKFKH